MKSWFIISFIALMAVLMPMVGGLAQARAATWDRNAAFIRREAELKKAIAAKPNDPAPLVALATFYLNPVVSRQVAAVDGQVRLCPAPLRDEVIVGGIKEVYAVPWVFRGDGKAAKPLLAAALKLNPKHWDAHRQLALYYRMRQDVDTMQRHVLEAIKVGGADLVIARLYLDYHTVRARVLNDEANRLRTPFEYEEDRADGKRYRVTRFPSEAAKAKAKQLDGQAQNHRREAVTQLRAVVKHLKDKPQFKSTHDLANAMFYHWIGKLETAGGAAKAALQADPTNLDALDYMIDLTRGTHTKNLYDHYRAIRDRWAGADTRIRKAKAPSRGPRQ